jgi:hypothetical protein
MFVCEGFVKLRVRGEGKRERETERREKGERGKI